MTFLASDVFDGARSPFLNDAAASLYTNTILLPHLKTANEELEQTLIINGISVQRVKSSPIAITAGATNLTILGSPALPTDFLFPISLRERTSGDSDYSWADMTEKDFEPDNQQPTTTFNYWAFRNNAIYFPPATVNRDILLKYERQLAVITGPNSPEDFTLAKRFLCARVAELAARYIGMNSDLADVLMTREVEPRKDDLTRLFILDDQEVRTRRKPFSTRR